MLLLPLLLSMLLVLLNVALAGEYCCCCLSLSYCYGSRSLRLLRDIDTNAASCVHLHVRLQAVMLAQKRHLDRFVQAHFLSQPVKMPLLSQHDCL